MIENFRVCIPQVVNPLHLKGLGSYIELNKFSILLYVGFCLLVQLLVLSFFLVGVQNRNGQGIQVWPH